MIKRLWSKFIDFFVHDFWRKLIALSFAILLYYTVSDRISSELSLERVPVLIDYPGDLVNLSDKPLYVRIVVTGSSRTLNALSTAEISCHAEVLSSKYVDGQPYSLMLEDRNFKLPFGVRLVRIVPQKIDLELERMVPKEVGVELKFNQRNFSADYSYEPGTILPDKVTLYGPRSLVEQIGKVPTEEIPLGGVTEPFEYQVALRPPADMTVLPPKVNVQVKVQRRIHLSRFGELPIALRTTAENGKYNYQVLSEQVNAEVELSHAGEVKKSQVHVFVNLAPYLTPGTYTVPVVGMCQDAPLAEIVSIKPASLVIKVTKKR